MTTAVRRASFTARFTCLAEACDDTCCAGWGMQVDDATYDLYAAKAPELAAATVIEEGSRVMRRNTSQACIRLDAGRCATHREYGTEFLSDACHFFPRITRRLGERVVQSASLGCPEIARLALLDPIAAPYVEEESARLPVSLRDVLPPELDAASALQVHDAFLAAIDDGVSAERLTARLVSVARSLDAQPPTDWAAAAGFYLRDPDPRLPLAEDNPSDLFLLLQAVCGIATSVHSGRRPRLDETLADMASFLAMEFDSHDIPHLTDASHAAHAAITPRLAAYQTAMQPLLRRYLTAQLAMTLFPFAGLGKRVGERALLLALRFAITRLGLLALPVWSDAGAIRVVQSLSRLLDHVADPTLQINILAETGWNRESRMRSLAGDSLNFA